MESVLKRIKDTQKYLGRFYTLRNVIFLLLAVVIIMLPFSGAFACFSFGESSVPEISSALLIDEKVKDKAPYVLGSVTSSNSKDSFRTYVRNFDDAAGIQVQNNALRYLLVDDSFGYSPLVFSTDLSGNPIEIPSNWVATTSYGFDRFHGDFATFDGSQFEKLTARQIYLSYDLALALVDYEVDALSSLVGQSLPVDVSYSEGGSPTVENFEIMGILSDSEKSTLAHNNFFGDRYVVASYNFNRTFEHMSYWFAMFGDAVSVQLGLEWVFKSIESNNQQVQYSLHLYGYNSDDETFSTSPINEDIAMLLSDEFETKQQQFRSIGIVLFGAFLLVNFLFVFALLASGNVFTFPVFCVSSLFVAVIYAILNLIGLVTIGECYFLAVSQIGALFAFLVYLASYVFAFLLGRVGFIQRLWIVRLLASLFTKKTMAIQKRRTV